MDSAQTVAIVALVVFAAASFFCSLAETALFSLGKLQLRQLLQSDFKKGAAVERLLHEPQDLLGTMAFGNTFALGGMLAFGLWMALTERWLLWPTVVGLFILVVFFCEVLPKTLAVRRAEYWALRVAGLVTVLHQVVSPLRRAAQSVNGIILRAVIPSSVKPLPALDDAAYKELLEMAQQQGALEATEKGNHPANHPPRPAHGRGCDEAAFHDRLHSGYAFGGGDDGGGAKVRSPPAADV
jgi:CBS domain containing-hemolysin-like protein